LRTHQQKHGKDATVVNTTSVTKRIISTKYAHLIVLAALLCFLQACAVLRGTSSDVSRPEAETIQPEAPVPQAKVKRPEESTPTPAPLPQTGEASWYGGNFDGKKTASGDTFDQNDYTAAHRSLPFGTKVKVTNLDNGKSVNVEITDRGPFAGNRIIDLSHAAAKALEFKENGTARVRVEAMTQQ
jgi:rare lipoprotein A